MIRPRAKEPARSFRNATRERVLILRLKANLYWRLLHAPSSLQRHLLVALGQLAVGGSGWSCAGKNRHGRFFPDFHTNDMESRNCLFANSSRGELCWFCSYG